MKVGIQIAVFTMLGKGSSTLRVPVKNFMGKHCKCMASYTNIWSTLEAITLILRRQSKFYEFKTIIFSHSACTCKKFPPKWSVGPGEFYLFIFST